MARSLRDLVEFLLEEISLCGAQGASPAHIVELIDTYYANPVRLTSNYVNKRTAQKQEGRAPKLDRLFKEKVWTWLTKNPEVSVGKDREGNGLSLSDALGADYVWPNPAKPTAVATEGNGAASSRPVAYPAGVAVPEPGSTPDQAKSDPKHHVYVSEERMWFAIADHGPDPSRLLPTEFALLSIIASHKGNGITQPELVRVSGQDKRSVPKRTDALSEKGYIEKKRIQFKSARTSLCTLRKFVGTPTYLDGSFQTPAERGKAKAHEEGDVIDFSVFLDNLFKWLKEYKLIGRNDLKEKLGMADGWRWRILSRALSKLERIGCVKRLRAQSQYKLKTYHPSVMLIREPTERDLQLFHENSKGLLTFSESGQTAGQELEDGAETNRKVRSKSSPLSGGKVRAPRKENIQESGRIVPRWTPGRSLSNMIFDVVDKAGPQGMPNMDIKTVCFGSFFRRSLETFLNRLVDCWQYSQPPHLRHLAIIRDTALRGTITHYVHYSYHNFKHLVDNDEASWEAVEHVPKGPKSKTRPVPPVDAVAYYDENGFPIREKAYNLLKDGNATLGECLEIVQPGNYAISSTDPAAVKLEDGSYGVKHRFKRVPASIRRRAKMVKIMSAKGIPVNGSELRVTGSTLNEDVEIQSSDDLDQGEPPSKPGSVAADPFEGMSRREFLIAQGFDETWTEFCVCVQERTQPGVYVTPRGKRRAVVGKQGRPRISRIAVFKSEKLKELSWFTEPQEPPKIDEGHAAKRKATFDECVFGFPSRKLLNKRRRVTPNAAEKPGLESTSDGVTMSDHNEEHPPMNGENNTTGGDDEAQGVNKRKLPDEVPGIANSIEAGDQPPPKRKRGRPPKGSAPLPRTTQKGEKTRKGAKQPPKAASEQNNQTEKGASVNGEEVVTPAPALSEQPISVDGAKSSRPSDDHPALAPGQNVAVSATDASLGAADSNTGDASNPLSGLEETSLSSGPKLELSHTSASPNREVAEVAEVAEATEVNNVRSATMPSRNPETREPSSTQEQSPSQPETKEQSLEETPSPSKSGISRYSSGKLGLRMQKTGGGSIAFLRKKIVMDIMEKSGGIFPLGPELWYPFTTAWLKTKQTEKPDLRTVKSTVKTLVDAGKLRQLGFSGKDNKGIMVTKAIITLPEIEPTDERIQQMQKAMLSGDNCIPEGVEVDPTLRKSSSTPGKKKTKGNWPEIDTSVTVTLHQKPATIRAQENRKDLTIQRRLLQGARVASEALQRVRNGRVGRPPLHPRRAPGPSTSTPGTRPRRRRRAVNEFLDTSKYGLQKFKKGELCKRWRPISAISPYAMLMCPTQSFHPATGTFITGNLPPSEYSPERAEILPQGLDRAIENAGLLGISKYENFDERTKIFFSRLESISAWEITLDAVNYQTKEWTFVNHTVPGGFESVPIEGPIHYKHDLPPATRPHVEPKALRSVTGSLPVPRLQFQFRGVQQQVAPTTRPVISANTPVSAIPAPTLARKPRRRGPRAPGTKGRRLSKFAQGQEGTNIEASSTAEQTGDRQTVARRNRFARDLPPEVVQKIITAVVVVKSLVGGNEGKKVDWGILTTLFPNYEPKFIQQRGRTIMSNNRLQISKMQSDFQEIFAEAYERGEVPPIDYRNLMAYDWEWIVGWTKTQLEAPPTRKLPNLPASREQFDSLFEIRKDPPQLLNDIYRYNAVVTLPRKRAMFAGVPFAVPLQESDEPPRKRQRSDRLDTAKTWIRANVMAPEETYNPPLARLTLDRLFGEGLLDSAVKSLSAERVISAGNKSYITPGRTYDVTEHFLDTIGRKRALEAKQLKRASYFKINILDEDMRTKGKHDVNYAAEDGDILVIVNLIAEGRVEFRPRDPPNNKYGLTDGGYVTRLMDRNRLRFGVDVVPTDKYVYGNPIREAVASVPAPRADMDRTIALLVEPALPTGTMAAPPPPSASPGKIPMWFDIHGNFNRVIWDLAIAAVLGIIAARPGLSTKGIASALNPSMGEWDVELALQWIVEAGLAEKTRESAEKEEAKAPGWSVKEWWWLGIGEREGVASEA
ncbi:RNA polymerase III transcription initiation factor complex subunit [Arachnomyces sp. PD_36]|nr:RNA polymerase III transcription initiation factor complex subunit [Arachnomyces sp. PD_36]